MGFAGSRDTLHIWRGNWRQQSSPHFKLAPVTTLWVTRARLLGILAAGRRVDWKRESVYSTTPQVKSSFLQIFLQKAVYLVDKLQLAATCLSADDEGLLVPQAQAQYLLDHCQSHRPLPAHQPGKTKPMRILLFIRSYLSSPLSQHDSKHQNLDSSLV